jgi:hypothetical protein
MYFMRISGLLTSILFVFFPPLLLAQDVIYVGKFSVAAPGENLPVDWQQLTFKKIESHTRYSLVKDGNEIVVKAVSDASASGLIRKIKIDPQTYPIIRWQWKATRVYHNGDVTKKDGDDYPARIYITFERDPKAMGMFEKTKFFLAKQVYGEYPPFTSINYIWANKTPVGTVVPSPYTDRSRMIVVESGKAMLNTWVLEERNILDDYVRAFGEKPFMISGIAIMTDSDNTKESATAFYGDILLKQK